LAMWLQLANGLDAKAEATLADMARTLPADSATLASNRAALEWFKGRYDSASVHIRRTAGWDGELWRAAEAELHGRFRDAQKHLDAASRILGLTPNDRGLFGLVSAQLALARGDVAEALTQADRVLAAAQLPTNTFDEPPQYGVAIVYAQAGRSDKARATLNDFERRTPPQERGFYQRQRPRALAFIALAENDPAAAVREFAAWRDTPGCFICKDHPELGRAYELLGQRDSAIAVYERFLQNRSSVTVPFAAGLSQYTGVDRLWQAPALERLAMLYESKSDRQRAARAYRAFVELWKDGDPEVQPRVAHARGRLAALSSAN
jgi:tetratricopeptide (TPR) repeat protein